MTNQIILFCLPYAGGSAKAIYDKWGDSLHSSLKIQPIELAGRGKRIAENLYSNLEEAINDVLEQIIDEIIHNDYAFFGHSMGSILTYKVLQRIDDLKLPPPIHCFFSGRRAPHCVSRKVTTYSKMNDLELENELKELGGTPPEFFEYPELKNIFLPIIKSDFKIADTLVDKSEILVLNHDISVFIGNKEDVTKEEANEWIRHTNKKCSIEYFDGGHFFLLNQMEAVVSRINNCLIKKSKYISI